MADMAAFRRNWIDSTFEGSSFSLVIWAKLSKDELELLRNFLKQFKEATTEIEGSKYPTLHLVNP